MVLESAGMKEPYFASSISVEHYTPRYIWARAIRCMGAIDCDPSADPGRHIPAAVHYTKKENGLIHEWGRRVWMNPPFGDLIPEFFGKLEKEIEAGRTEEAIILWKAATETDAWRQITAVAVLIAFPHHRIEFMGGTVKGEKGSNFSPALFYIGPNPEKFIEAFSDISDIWKPIKQSRKIPPSQLRIIPEPAREDPAAENHPLERWGVA
jgi:hypothetical protein